MVFRGDERAITVQIGPCCCWRSSSPRWRSTGSTPSPRFVEHGEIPPSIERFDAVGENHDQHARMTVDWEASAGDAGITCGELELIDDTGTVVDAREDSYPEEGRVVEDGIQLEEKGGSGTEYEIRLTVADSNGNSRDRSITRTG